MEFKYAGAINSIFNMIKTMDNFSKNVLSGTNLTRMEAVYLRISWENPGTSQRELARLNNTDKSIAVSYITKLEKKKMIRKEDIHNKKLIYCTELGEDTIKKITFTTQKTLDKVFEGYDSKDIMRYFEITQFISEKLSGPEMKMFIDSIGEE